MLGGGKAGPIGAHPNAARQPSDARVKLHTLGRRFRRGRAGARAGCGGATVCARSARGPAHRSAISPAMLRASPLAWPLAADQQTGTASTSKAVVPIRQALISTLSSCSMGAA